AKRSPLRLRALDDPPHQLLDRPGPTDLGGLAVRLEVSYHRLTLPAPERLVLPHVVDLCLEVDAHLALENGHRPVSLVGGSDAGGYLLIAGDPAPYDRVRDVLRGEANAQVPGQFVLHAGLQLTFEQRLRRGVLERDHCHRADMARQASSHEGVDATRQKEGQDRPQNLTAS